MTTFYDFEAAKLNGKTSSMKEYKGKTIVVVNTASKCGFTPQYEGLEKLYQQYKDKGLVILGFPCNQFANQESGSSNEIEEFCQVNYGVTFPLFEKIEVNGENTHPIFKFLKSSVSNGLFGSKIKWNFTKFIVNSQGVPVKRFAPTTQPEKMEKTILQLLRK
jgi:glutathione peroxidase